MWNQKKNINSDTSLRAGENVLVQKYCIPPLQCGGSLLLVLAMAYPLKRINCYVMVLKIIYARVVDVPQGCVFIELRSPYVDVMQSMFAREICSYALTNVIYVQVLHGFTIGARETASKKHNQIISEYKVKKKKKNHIPEFGNIQKQVLALRRERNPPYWCSSFH